MEKRQPGLQKRLRLKGFVRFAVYKHCSFRPSVAFLLAGGALGEAPFVAGSLGLSGHVPSENVSDTSSDDDFVVVTQLPFFLEEGNIPLDFVAPVCEIVEAIKCLEQSGSAKNLDNPAVFIQTLYEKIKNVDTALKQAVAPMQVHIRDHYPEFLTQFYKECPVGGRQFVLPFVHAHPEYASDEALVDLVDELELYFAPSRSVSALLRSFKERFEEYLE